MKNTYYMIDSKFEAHACTSFSDACYAMQHEVIRKGGENASSSVCERDSKGVLRVLDYMVREGRSLIDPEFVPAGYPEAAKKAVARLRAKNAKKAKK